MKVFRIEPDGDRYQYFLVRNRRLVERNELKFDCHPIENWQPPEVLSYEPKHKAGDFWGFDMYSAWATTPRATKMLQRFFIMAGQVLPLPFENTTYGLLNVTECVNCLDPTQTEWVVGETSGSRLWISKYAFQQDLLPESSIFKIPETAESHILCYEGVKSPEDEFKPFVERHKLEGLLFIEIWDHDLTDSNARLAEPSL